MRCSNTTANQTAVDITRNHSRFWPVETGEPMEASTALPKNYTHLIVNHSVNFVDSVTGAQNLLLSGLRKSSPNTLVPGSVRIQARWLNNSRAHITPTYRQWTTLVQPVCGHHNSWLQQSVWHCQAFLSHGENGQARFARLRLQLDRLLPWWPLSPDGACWRTVWICRYKRQHYPRIEYRARFLRCRCLRSPSDHSRKPDVQICRRRRPRHSGQQHRQPCRGTEQRREMGRQQQSLSKPKKDIRDDIHETTGLK